MRKSLLPIASLASGLVGLYFFHSLREITTSSIEFERWASVIISNKTVLFFANLILIGLIGGYFSSKQRTPGRKLLVLVPTWIVIFAVGGILSKSSPL